MSTKTILFQLLPKGTYSNKGYVTTLSDQYLRFDIWLDRGTHVNNETMVEEQMATVSITGSNNRAWSGDQGIERLVEQYGNRVSPADRKKFFRIVDIWRAYHLNDLTAGTKKQEDAVAIWRLTNEYDFDKARKYLEEIGLNPDKGYKYGSSWLCRKIPDEDVTFLQNL